MEHKDVILSNINGDYSHTYQKFPTLLRVSHLRLHLLLGWDNEVHRVHHFLTNLVSYLYHSPLDGILIKLNYFQCDRNLQKFNIHQTWTYPNTYGMNQLCKCSIIYAKLYALFFNFSGLRTITYSNPPKNLIHTNFIRQKDV